MATISSQENFFDKICPSWVKRFIPNGLKNPGQLDAVHAHAKEAFATPHMIDGFKLDMNRPLSNNLQMGHVLNLGSSNGQSYHYSATYVGGEPMKEGNQDNSFPVMLGDISTDGTLNAMVIHSFAKGFTHKMQALLGSKGQFQGVYETEYKGGCFTTKLSAHNPDLFLSNGAFVFSHLQRITDNIRIGGEALYHEGFNYRALAHFELNNGCSFSIDASPIGTLQAYFSKKVADYGLIATEFEYDARQNASVTSIGYTYDFISAKCRAQVDSNGLVQSCIEQKISQGMSLVLTGALDHYNGMGKFGIAFLLGPR